MSTEDFLITSSLQTLLPPKKESNVHSIPGSFPCSTEAFPPTNIELSKTCVHHWICDPPNDSTSLCVCQKCFDKRVLKNRVYIPTEHDGYTMMGGSVGGGSPLTGADLINGIGAEY